MTGVRDLRTGQKVVLVIGLAAVACVAGGYVVSDGFRATSGGWFPYPTNATDTYFAARRPSPARALWIPLALALAWTLIAVWVFGPPGHDDSDQ